ncbi:MULTISPECIES: protoporphyrinogen oxidase [unclassified Exiguobacterium]|uniref:protoporphyrinogen oxidase n=1 Tax=unclassified Exiguobacterium TaxID=2644629 RepID=UPI00103BFEF6|nr:MULTISPECIES: protoporphyrinogen oxidase [unclassified Exiguobacterium]TCI44718.1 protoporphyrinogen oxidase [Exiguobacterium sp. SH5S32]TCI51125.1 protoporphyrinogen oxidase [Exiguobacterium sp. SH1S4]TCI70099.1 protoporphyrinogen oxidase [Exiguobacterium sp. SH1S1]
MNQLNNIAIIGGGITGMAAAYYAKQAGAHVTLYESSDRVGGKIKTVYRDGFVLECGPDGYMARKPTLTELITELGLDEQLVRSQTGTSYIYVRNKLRQMPNGSVMGIPTKFWPMVKTDLFTWRGKARAGMDLVLPRVYAGEDISLDTFFRTRLGSEVVESMIEPLLSGIYNGTLQDMSIESTFPQFITIEQKTRSLILGMKALTPPVQAGVKPREAGKFLSLQNGLGILIEALRPSIDRLYTGTRVASVRPHEIELEDGTIEQFDGIILATSPNALGPILGIPEAERLSQLKRTSSITVLAAFDEKDVASLDGTGYVIAKAEANALTACSWMHKKWSHMAPKGKALLRVYIGSDHVPDLLAATDQAVAEFALNELRKIQHVGTPLFTKVERHVDTMPQYEVGHKQHVHAFEHALAALDGVEACGAILHGVGLPDCVDSAKQAVMRAMTAKQAVRS